MSVATIAVQKRDGTRLFAPRHLAPVRPLPVRPTPVRPAPTRPGAARPAVWTSTTRGRTTTVHACSISRPMPVVAGPSDLLLGLQLAGVALVFLLGIAAVVAVFLGFSDAPLAVLPPA